MRNGLARDTSLYLQEIATRCERVQQAIADLLGSLADQDRGPGGRERAARSLTDLQEIDRITQQLRDLAEVHRALSVGDGSYGSVSAEARAVQAARLEDTRRALGKLSPTTRAAADLGSPPKDTG